MPTLEWRHIVVAVRSPDLRRQIAIRKATRIAARCGARITLLHAFSMPYPLPARIPSQGTDILKMVGDDRRKQLRKLAQPLRAQGLRVNCQVVWDFPSHDAIVRYVVKSKADVLVAESQRHTRIGRWFLANTDWELIRECPCPVWFVKNERFSGKPLFMTAVDPTHARAKPSRLDDRLLGMAVVAAEQLDGRVAVVHGEDVMQVLPKGFMADVLIPGAAVEASRFARASARKAITRLLERHGVPAALQIIRPGLPAEVIAAAVKQTKTDVLVLGAVSRRGLQRTYIGTTAEQVIDAVACDLLVVKPAGFRTSVSRRGPTLS